MKVGVVDVDIHYFKIVSTVTFRAQSLGSVEVCFCLTRWYCTISIIFAAPGF